jgi:NAD(P)-dependent dehydrogenase (short-subunit alcohol dehydrogenase family)
MALLLSRVTTLSATIPLGTYKSQLAALRHRFERTFLSLQSKPRVFFYSAIMSLKDKVIVITGAASGMGLETARLFAKKGAKLSLADVQEKPLKELEGELQQSGAQIITQVVDVRDRKAVEAWIAATVEKFGKLDGAANLAGVIGKQANVVGIDGLDDDEWDFVMGVNVVGLKNCLRAQVPHFNEGAAIVNAASILGLIGAAKNLAYCASKHAVVGMTRSAAKELGPKKIRVNCICPYVARK